MAAARDVDRALERFAEELSAKSNVVGLGRVPAEGAAGEWKLAVYVSRKLPDKALAAADRVPPRLSMPKRGGRPVEIETAVIEQGEVALEGG